MRRSKDFDLSMVVAAIYEAGAPFHTSIMQPHARAARCVRVALTLCLTEHSSAKASAFKSSHCANRSSSHAAPDSGPTGDHARLAI